MSSIVIYRKGNTPPKASAKAVAEMREQIATRCRVQRPGLVALFTPAKSGQRSGFYRLPEVAPAIIDNPPERQSTGAGFVIEAEDLGRKVRNGGEADASTAQSVLLWIKQNLGAVVNPADVSVTVEER